MKKTFVFALCMLSASLFSTGCYCTKKAVSKATKDSIVFETHTEYIERVRDTVIYIDMPVESREKTVPENQSFLETSLACSEARINADGTLSHSLENKVQPRTVTVPITDKERIVTAKSENSRSEVIGIPVKQPLRKWEKFLLFSGVLFWGVIIGRAVWSLKRNL